MCLVGRYALINQSVAFTKILLFVSETMRLQHTTVMYPHASTLPFVGRVARRRFIGVGRVLAGTARRRQRCFTVRCRADLLATDTGTCHRRHADYVIVDSLPFPAHYVTYVA